MLKDFTLIGPFTKEPSLSSFSWKQMKTSVDRKKDKVSRMQNSDIQCRKMWSAFCRVWLALWMFLNGFIMNELSVVLDASWVAARLGQWTGLHIRSKFNVRSLKGCDTTISFQLWSYSWCSFHQFSFSQTAFQLWAQLPGQRWASGLTCLWDIPGPLRTSLMESSSTDALI